MADDSSGRSFAVLSSKAIEHLSANSIAENPTSITMPVLSRSTRISLPLLTRLPLRRLATPADLTGKTGPRQSTTPPIPPDQEKPVVDETWIYSKERDPMANMSEEEKEAIRKHIRQESARMFSISYGIIGGGMLIAGLAVWYNLSPGERRR
ncbi:hypothetical protein SpCBS45565_g01782 [Spizellomyces sp. 'palustris']|nr:hypothetical protein SpCBS45565_g01782 [Spizellomyces sp. 'palustris']